MDLIKSAAWEWYRFKHVVEGAGAIGNDAIHVLVGGLGMLILAWLTRRGIAAWRPWLIMLAAALLNEAIDLSLEQWPDLAHQYGESIKDIALTMAMPTALLLFVRAFPSLARPRR